MSLVLLTPFGGRKINCHIGNTGCLSRIQPMTGHLERRGGGDGSTCSRFNANVATILF